MFISNLISNRFVFYGSTSRGCAAYGYGISPFRPAVQRHVRVTGRCVLLGVFSTLFSQLLVRMNCVRRLTLDKFLWSSVLYKLFSFASGDFTPVILVGCVGSLLSRVVSAAGV